MDALEFLGITEEEAATLVKNKKARGRRDSRICLCGHGGGAHYVVGEGEPSGDIANYEKGKVACQAGRVPCLCNYFYWVLTAGDVRPFIQKTEGPGVEHALTRGVASAVQKKIEVSWRDNLVCFKCQATDGRRLTLIPYNPNGVEAKRSTGIDAMYCDDCREEFRAQVMSRG